MGLKFGKKKSEKDKQKQKVVGQLRQSQIVTTFGSGAIADLPDYSVIMAATDYWSQFSPIIHEPNLEKLLHVSSFKMPYTTEAEDNPDIPAFRFPNMYFCPQCKRLMPYWAFGDEKGHTCQKCKKEIVPSRFVAADINGHLEDFPYRWWVHKGDFSKCPDGKNDKLKISFSDDSGGLESIRITCTECGATRTMAGSLAHDALKGYHCHGSRPWLGGKKHNDPEPCHAQMRALHRTASNVYFAQTESALTIPPWSSRLSQLVEDKWETIQNLLNIKADEDTLRKVFSGVVFKKELEEEFFNVNDILEAVQRRQQHLAEKEYTRQDLLEDEYKVFCLNNYENWEEGEFCSQSVKVPDVLSELIEGLIMVKRLREVLALTGFRRIVPSKPDTSDPRYAGYFDNRDIVSLSSKPLGWYPAIELLGEGIFLRLKEDRLAEWEKSISEHYEPLRLHLERSIIQCPNFSPRYVLLHTLAHLLIRQLSVECGYSGAAIKERIYSTYPASGDNMAGILLYTSSSDSDGSLGGLVRNAESDNFERVFRNMLQNASWCSSDPVCIENMAQGYDSLNYAACHACTLLPETCCEMRNCLLDRASVVGTFDDRSIGYFGTLFERMMDNG